MIYKFTEQDEKTVLAVFDSLMHMPYTELNTFLGSETIKEMTALYWKLKYLSYCESVGKTYEEMTEEDFMDAYLKENEI